MNILRIRLQAVREFFKIKAETSKISHAWLWRVQAFALRLLGEHGCPVLLLLGLLLWESLRSMEPEVFALHPSYPCMSWGYTPSKMVVGWWESWNAPWILQDTEYVLFIFDSTIHQPTPHSWDVSASCVCHPPAEYPVLCVRHIVGVAHASMETFSVSDTQESPVKGEAQTCQQSRLLFLIGRMSASTLPFWRKGDDTWLHFWMCSTSVFYIFFYY